MPVKIFNNIPWGTHLCQFYQTKEDLIAIVVPYFKAGLENNEFCMWITPSFFSKNEAESVLRTAVSGLDGYLRKGQMEIISHTEWYLKDGVFDMNRVINSWLSKLKEALNKGYKGMRVTGTADRIEKKSWSIVVDYEKRVSDSIRTNNFIALCSYPVDACGASELIEVVNKHQFTLIKREGKWVIIGNTEQSRIMIKNKVAKSRPALPAMIDIKVERGEFTAGIAHEIRNPLSVISMTVQYLQSKFELNDPRREYTESIINKVERLDKIAKGLTDYSKSPQLNLKNRNILRILTQAISLVKAKCKSSKIRVISQLPRSLPMVSVDEEKIDQVFLNIFNNAIDAMSGGGSLFVSAECAAEPGEIVIKISDTGKGITPKNLQKIFTPFFTTKKEKGGVGLGLSISLNIILAHKGTINVQSKSRGKNKGTTFIIRLPMVS